MTSARLRLVILCVAVFFTFRAPASAAPGAATLVAPSGEITGSTIVFTWNAAPDSTWYQFWIGSSAGMALQQWYTAEQARCAGGGTCSITLTLGIGAGAYNWYVQTWNPSGVGAWSLGNGITLKELNPTWNRRLPVARRFSLVFDDAAVLDHETGLVWERVPSATQFSYFNANHNRCWVLILGGRMGWRLPSVSELLSVTDPNTTEGLPPGHPFDLGASPHFFWTSNRSIATPENIVIIQITALSNVYIDTLSGPRRAWCVRGAGTDRTQ